MINYEKEYQNSRNVCGEPFPEIVEFFENYDDECATILDLGCGQGRDALFIARKGTFGFRSGYGSNRTLIRFVPNEVRKYTLIALSTTGKFPDTVKEGTTYTATEFEMVLNSLRNMNTVKAEEPHEFTIKGN